MFSLRTNLTTFRYIRHLDSGSLITQAITDI